MYYLGARRVAVVSAPPFGCMPLVMTFQGVTKCDAELNKVAFSLSLKLKTKLEILNKSLRIKTSFVDIYDLILNIIQNPKPYGKYHIYICVTFLAFRIVYLINLLIYFLK